MQALPDTLTYIKYFVDVKNRTVRTYTKKTVELNYDIHDNKTGLSKYYD